MNKKALIKTPIDDWSNAAYSILIEKGIDAVKILTLAKKTGLSRTGFYWYFKDIEELLDLIVEQWEERNTGALITRTNTYAETITEAMFNVFDCWYDSYIFDAPLDLAIRNWARNDDKLKERVERADAERLKAIKKMFQRFDYPKAQAEVRSLTVIYTQIGYISMEVKDDWNIRTSRAAHYCEVFTGQKPSKSEFKRFKSRHEKI